MFLRLRHSAHHLLKRNLHALNGPYPPRTLSCGHLSAENVDSVIVLAGWIQPQRKVSSSLSFFNIKDASGSTQLVANRDTPQSSALLDRLASVPYDSVLLVQGSVRQRPQAAKRLSDPTGEVEVLIHDFTVLNPADHRHMPFIPSDTHNLANDELRARYRHLDLRRPQLTHNLHKRGKVTHLIRNFLHDHGFVEVETPILLKSSPEGAREFLVPTRTRAGVATSGNNGTGPGLGERNSNDIEAGSRSKSETDLGTSTASTTSEAQSSLSATPPPSFYALSQSPQQPKQLLICSGAVDRYYQIARCFRDEDGRKDRQPEFTQVDLEMAFVSWGGEGGVSSIVNELKPNLVGSAGEAGVDTEVTSLPISSSLSPSPLPSKDSDDRLNDALKRNQSHLEASPFSNSGGRYQHEKPVTNRLNPDEMEESITHSQRSRSDAKSDIDPRSPKSPLLPPPKVKSNIVSIPKLTNTTWRIGGVEVRNVMEELMRSVWKEVEGVDLPSRFPVLTYWEAMSRFGSDKPDTRFGLEIANVTELLPRWLRDVCNDEGQIVECFVVPAQSEFAKASASQLRGRFEQVNGIKVSEKIIPNWLSRCDVVRSVVPPSEAERALEFDTSAINEHLGLKSGDYVWVSRRNAEPEGGSTPLGKVRSHLAQHAQVLGTYEPSKDPHFLWVTEFPLFTRADDDKEFLARGRWSSTHHPFTAPMAEDVEKLLNGEIKSVRGQHYDLVLNGVEIGGGSVRVHDATMQEYIFTSVIQLTDREKESFGHLLHALRCGAPPHGGMALGFDRLMAILCGTETIRDVIAFPKTGAGTDLFFKSPSPVDENMLSLYGLARAN